MKKIIIAAIARNGVIGRTTKACEVCHGFPPRSNFYSTCPECDGEGRVPANDLPWGNEYPEHDALVERETMGHAVIMGRRTMESIPSKFFPLSNRTTCIVSKTLYEERLREAVARCNDWKTFGFLPHLTHEPLTIIRTEFREIIERLSGHGSRDTDRAYIIGGAQLYAAALPLADELVLTLIDREWAGDVLFPGWRYATPPKYGSATLHAEKTFEGTFQLVEHCTGNDPDLTFTRWRRAR